MLTRDQYKPLLERTKEPRRFIQVIAGPRQVGKTTLALQCMENAGMIHHFASADESSDMSPVWIDQQWEAARIKGDNKRVLLVLDEVQKINNWSQAVKKNWDKDTKDKRQVKVVLLGSSRLLLQEGLTESLAGRFELLLLPHWSYSEMKKSFNYSPEEYVWFGGYPGAASLVKDPARWKDYVLHSLIETTISKDILMLSRVDKPALLRHLFELGCAYSGQILSYNKMLGQLHDAGNTTTLAHYLKLLDSAGLLTGLEKYSHKQIRSRASSPKLQVRDTSLLSVFSKMSYKEVRQRPEIWGRHVESAIGSHLVNSAVAGGYDVFYWREGNDEVDFIIRKKGSVIAIEVKTAAKQKLPGLTEFTSRFSPNKMLLVGDEGLKWQDFLKMNPGELF
ncbi:MAG: ATP-binding protein [Bacteroidetes bacterium]|nr:ATP-binding protein [Bacteroidota bacterium]